MDFVAKISNSFIGMVLPLMPFTIPSSRTILEHSRNKIQGKSAHYIYELFTIGRVPISFLGVFGTNGTWTSTVCVLVTEMIMQSKVSAPYLRSVGSLVRVSAGSKLIGWYGRYENVRLCLGQSFVHPQLEEPLKLKEK